MTNFIWHPRRKRRGWRPEHLVFVTPPAGGWYSARCALSQRAKWIALWKKLTKYKTHMTLFHMTLFITVFIWPYSFDLNYMTLFIWPYYVPCHRSALQKYTTTATSSALGDRWTLINLEQITSSALQLLGVLYISHPPLWVYFEYT